MTVVLVLGLSAPNATTAASNIASSACVAGWAASARPSAGSAVTLDATTIDGQLWVAGALSVEGAKQSGFVARDRDSGWKNVTPSTGAQGSAINAIAQVGSRGLWAAGSTVGPTQTQPLIMRFTGTSWTHMSVPTLSKGGTLAGIANTGTGKAVAVGYSGGVNGPHPLAERLVSGHWQSASPTVGLSGALTAIASLPGGDKALAVGWTSGPSGLHPLIAEWSGHAWKTYSLSNSAGVVFSSVAVAGGSTAWAAGYRQDPTGVHPALARWDGFTWKFVTPPPIAMTEAILRDVAVVGADVLVAGAAWNTLVGVDSHPVVARLSGGTWTVALDPGGVRGGDIHAISSGHRLALVGRGGSRSLVLRPCASTEADANAPTNQAGPDQATSPVAEDEIAATVVAPQPAVRPDGASIESSSALHRFTIRDVTAAVGLKKSTPTYGGLVTDLNGDGWADLVIGEHTHPLLLLQRAGAGFSQLAKRYDSVDLHGCSAGDLDHDGLPELVCAVGGAGGLGIRSNVLWLDTADPSATNQAENMSLLDPLGRGRQTTILDVNRDGWLDVLISNDPSRVDALPSINRLFLNQAGAGFVADPQAGLDLAVGASCLVPVDYDRDGWTDLIVCQTLALGGYAAIRVFHNNRGHFSDVTAALHLTPRSDVDAASADFNGDRRADIVRVSRTAIEVDTQKPNGRFEEAWSASSSGIQHIAVGDFNGDGRPDLYVTRGTATTRVQDLLLIQVPGSRLQFTSVALPSIQRGQGGGALVLDYDHNGKDDILVMGGNFHQSGPLQMLAFGPPWPTVWVPRTP